MHDCSLEFRKQAFVSPRRGFIFGKALMEVNTPEMVARNYAFLLRESFGDFTQQYDNKHIPNKIHSILP